MGQFDSRNDYEERQQMLFEEECERVLDRLGHLYSQGLLAVPRQFAGARTMWMDRLATELAAGKDFIDALELAGKHTRLQLDHINATARRAA